METTLPPGVAALPAHHVARAGATITNSTGEDLSFEKFYTSIYINMAIGALCIVGFSLIHRRKIFGLYRFYAPRKKAIDNPISATFWKSLVLWIWQSLRYTDDRLWRTHGPDALVYVQFIRLCLGMSIALLFVGLIIVLPINYSGTNDYKVTEMGRFTISNLHDDDPKMIAHIVFTYLYSFGGYAIMWWSYRHYAVVRRRYMDRSEPRSFTLLLRNIPDRLMDKPELQRWFEDHMHTKVVDVQFVYSAQSLDRLKKKRNKYLDKLERAEITYQRRKQKQERREQAKSQDVGFWDGVLERVSYCLSCNWFRSKNEYQTLDDLRPVKRLGFFVFSYCGPKVDAITYYREKIKKVNRVIKAHLRSSVVEKRFKKAHSAFITFDSMYPARAPPQPFIDPHLMKVEAAPEPSDVHWEQVTIPYFSRIVRQLLVSGALTFLIVLWVFPVVAVQSLANLQTLSKVEYLTWLQPIIEVMNDISPQILAVVEGFLPSLVLLIFISITKPIIELLYSHQGESSYSRIEWMTMATYWGFLIFNVFLVSTIGGAILKVLDDFVDNPRSIINLLASSLPQQSGFFINYLLIAGFGRLPLKLFRLPALVQRIFTIILCKPVTEREKKKQYRPESFDYSLEVAEELLVFTLTLCYSLMAPLITIFGFAYFCLVFLINRYNLIYVNEQRWQGGGTMWSIVYHLFMAAILLFQLIMLGILGLSQYGGGLTLVVLPFITAVLWFWIHKHWGHTTTWGPLEGTDVIKPQSWDEFVGAYLQPPLQRDEEDAVDNGWYDEDNEEKSAQERQIDESSLGGAELWSWKTAKLQDAVRRSKNRLLGKKQPTFISPLLDPLLGDALLLDLTSDGESDDEAGAGSADSRRGTYQQPQLGGGRASGGSSGASSGAEDNGSGRRRRRTGSSGGKTEERRSTNSSRKGKEKHHSARRSVEDVEREEDGSERYSVGGDVEQGEAGWKRVSARHGDEDYTTTTTTAATPPMASPRRRPVVDEANNADPSSSTESSFSPSASVGDERLAILRSTDA